MTTKKSAKAGPKGSAASRKKPTKDARASIAWPELKASLPLRDFYFRVLLQAARMATSSDMALKLEGEKLLREAAERVAMAEVYKVGQKSRRQDRPGIDEGITADAERNDRIRAAYVRSNGERGTIKRLAIDFNLSEKQISRIVKDMRT